MEQAVLDRISILITVYKTPALVKRCVDSILAACGGHLPETVIIDDAAGDEATAQVAQSYRKYGAKFAVMPQNGGFAGANNFGYTFCTKEFVILVNSDIVLHEEPFTAMTAFMDNHPKADIISGKLVIRNGQPGVDGKLNGTGSYFSPLGLMVPIGWLKDADDPVAATPVRVFAACGAFFMIRNGLHNRVGGTLFHDHFHTYYEEVDLCHRTWLAGGEVWYVPTPIIGHALSATVNRFYTREDVLRKYYRNIRFSYATCFGLRGRLLVRPVFECICLGQVIVKLLKGDASALREHVWAFRQLHKMAGEIKKTRKIIQGFRVMNDTALFKRIMRHYPLRQFLESIRGNT